MRSLQSSVGCGGDLATSGCQIEAVVPFNKADRACRSSSDSCSSLSYLSLSSVVLLLNSVNHQRRSNALQQHYMVYNAYWECERTFNVQHSMLSFSSGVSPRPGSVSTCHTRSKHGMISTMQHNPNFPPRNNTVNVSTLDGALLTLHYQASRQAQQAHSVHSSVHRRANLLCISLHAHSCAS
jgi:hypothetical protein